MATELTIGKLADAAGVNVETIRYYQRRGLLDEPAKPLGGHRRYPVCGFHGHPATHSMSIWPPIPR